MENRFQARTTADKLRGQYYTPEALVATILDALPIEPDCRIVDPSCGDGSFLRGAVEAIARRFPGRARAAEWAERIVGIDSDPAAVAAARETLADAFRAHLGVDLSPDSFRVARADPLREPSLAALLQTAGAPLPGAHTRLLVLGNPPYVEAKRLPRETKAELGALHPEAVTGAPDLYLYFLHVCLGWLRPGDRLAFVLPNKLLVNTNARPLREALLREGRLQGLWLATRTGVFPGAAVYPVILLADGGGEDGPVAVRQVLRGERGGLIAEEPVGVPRALYRATAARAFFPPPESPVLRGALERLLGLPPEARLDAHLDIRWSVSFHRAGLRERYVTAAKPASPHARKFLGGGPFAGNGEVARYRLAWGGWWIDYDAERLRAEKNPLPSLSLFEQPKIVICQNGRTLRAACDPAGHVLKDTFLCGLLRQPEHPLGRHPRALVGLLCSRAVHFFYAHVFYGGHVNGGYLHFLRSFLVDVPVGAWEEERAAEADRLVARRERAETAPEREELEEQIEALVAEALDLTPPETAAIRAWAAADQNWQARERVRGPGKAT